MDIRIKTTGCEMTPEISSYLEERTASIMNLLGSDAPNARLEIELARAAGNQRHGEYLWRAEFLLTYPGAPAIRASNHAATINAAIDDARQELLVQLRSNRSAHRTLARKAGATLKRLMRLE